MKKNFVITILSLIFVFHLLNNVIYHKIDTQPFSWDESWHAGTSLYHYNNFAKNIQPDLKEISPLIHERSTKYPHLFHMSSIPLYLLFGFSEDAAVLTNLIFLAILLFFTYLTGKELYDEKTGVLASAMISMYPVMFGLSRFYLIDFSLVAFSMVSFFFLIKFKNSARKIYPVFFIMASILGLFTKQIFGIFIITPFLFVAFYKMYGQVRYPRMNKAHLISASILITAAACWLAYVYVDRFAGKFLLNILFERASMDQLVKNLPKAFFSMIRVQMSFVFFALFLCTLIFCRRIKEKTIFLLWILFPVFFLAATETLSSGRYLMPILPAFAIISSAGVFSIKGKKPRVILIAALLAYSLIQFFDVSYMKEKHELKINELYLYTNKMYIIREPKAHDWKIEEILDFVRDHARRSGEKKRVIVEVACVKQRFNEYNFAFAAYKNRLYDLLILNMGVSPFRADYIILNLDPKQEGPGDHTAVKRVLEAIKSNPDRFELLRTYRLPNATDAQVYRTIRAQVEDH